MYRKVTPAGNKALEISCNEEWTKKHLGFLPVYRLNFVLEPDSSWPDGTVFGFFVESVSLGLRTGPQRVDRKQSATRSESNLPEGNAPRDQPKKWYMLGVKWCISKQRHRKTAAETQRWLTGETRVVTC